MFEYQCTGDENVQGRRTPMAYSIEVALRVIGAGHDYA
jgi:hypothetical protein